MKSTILLVFILHSICSIGKPNLNLFAKLNKNPISQVENKKSPNFIKSKTHYEYSSGGDISIGNLDSFLYDNQGNLITTSMYNWDYYNGFTYSGKKNNIYQNDLLYYAYETDAIGDTILITSYFYDQNGNDTLEQNKILFKGAFFASYGERIKIIPKNSGSYIIHTSLDWDSIHQKLINGHLMDTCFLDSNGKLIKEADYTFIDIFKQWWVNYRYRYYYNANGKLDSSFWDNSCNQANTLYKKSKYIYNSKDLLNYEHVYFYLYFWQNDNFRISYYDISDRLIKYECIDTLNGKHVYYKDLYSYFDEANGVDDLPQKETVSFSIFPNPAQSYVNLKGFGFKPGKTELYCRDMLGRTIFSYPLQAANDGTLQTVIDISTLRQGIYQIEVWQENFKQEKKLIVR